MLFRSKRRVGEVGGGRVVRARGGIEGAAWVESERGGFDGSAVHGMGGGENLGGGHFDISDRLLLGGRGVGRLGRRSQNRLMRVVDKAQEIWGLGALTESGNRLTAKTRRARARWCGGPVLSWSFFVWLRSVARRGSDNGEKMILKNLQSGDQDLRGSCD